MIKCIVFPSPDKDYKNEFINISSFYETVFVDKNKCEFYSNWKHNESHLTTNTHYNYILPLLSNLLNFKYSLNDFTLIKKYDKTNTYNLSYLVPVINKSFDVTYNGKTEKYDFEKLIGYTNYEKNYLNFLKNTSFKDINPDYHLLFFAPHQCCIIKNLSANNNRKLLISGDSQLIPLIPILSYYFKEIIYLDRRGGDDGNVFNIDINDYDVLYSVSKYSYKKYEIDNFKKISFDKRIRCAIVATAKLENNYIKEWVEYHKSIGIDKIFLFDNNDIEGEKFDEVISDYINTGFVKIINKRGEVATSTYNLQSHICREGYMLASSENYNWIAIIDIDEYITFSNNFKNIKEFLSQSKFDNFDCIRLSWKLYNDSDLLKVEHNCYNLRNRFKTWKPHIIGKTIFRSKLVNIIKDLNGHGSKLAKASDEEGNELLYEERVSIVNRNPKDINAWINHYKTKTIEEFVKIRMYRKDINPQLHLHNLDKFFSYCKRTPEKEKLGKELLKIYNIQ